MLLKINGEEREIQSATTVEALLSELAIEAPRVAVEVNEKIVSKQNYSNTPIQAGDEIEIVSFVGGG